MVDINPADWVQQYTPRTPDLVDAVAEVRRIAEQQMRSNPLANGIVPYGLTRWRGNYGVDHVWIGEFNPMDPNLNRPQRGLSVVRDDPKGFSAINLYDPTPQPGVPLRQRLAFTDADNRRLLHEGQHDGGWAFPRMPVVLYPATVQTSTGAGNVAAWGRTSVVGRYLEYLYLVDIFNQWPVMPQVGFGNVNVPLETAAAETDARVSTYISVTGGGFTVSSSTEVSGPGAFFVEGRLDLGGGDGTLWGQRVDYANVDICAWLSAGGGTRNAFRIQPVHVHNMSDA